jgi:hypothetical protein
VISQNLAFSAAQVQNLQGSGLPHDDRWLWTLCYSTLVKMLAWIQQSAVNPLVVEVFLVEASGGAGPRKVPLGQSLLRHCTFLSSDDSCNVGSREW